MPSNAEQQRQQKPLPLHSDLVTPEIADPIPRFRPLRSKSRPKPPAAASELLDDVATEEVLKTKASGTQFSSLDNAKALPYSSSSSSSSRKRKAAEDQLPRMENWKLRLQEFWGILGQQTPCSSCYIWRGCHE
jgi:hypothetical protein